MEYGMEPLSNQDLVLLSAYLDGQLTEAEHQQLEKRLAQDTNLQAELASLQDVVHLVNSLPRLKAPRNFTLDPAIYGKQGATPVTITKITRLKMWQLSSLAGVAASILLVMAGLLIGNPFDASNEDESSAPNNVAQITQSKTDTLEADADTTMFREDETVIAILPSASVESQQDLGLTITAEVARAYATDTPSGSLDDDAGSNSNADGAAGDTSLFDTTEPIAQDDAVPPNVPAGGGAIGGEGENYAPSPEFVNPPSVGVTEEPSTTEAEGYAENANGTQNTQGAETDLAEEASGDDTSPNVAIASSSEEDDRDGEDAAADALPADGSQAEKYWIPFSDGLVITGTVGIIVTLASILLHFLIH